MSDPYEPPLGDEVALALSADPYQRPPGNQVGIEMVEGFVPTNPNQYLFPAPILAPAIGTHKAWNFHTYIQAQGASYAAIGSHSAQLYTRYIGLNTRGIPPGGYGTPSVVNFNKQAFPPGFNAGAYGSAVVFNLRQYVRPLGMATAAYGTAYVQGGVKYATPGGMLGTAFGGAVVINTTANQYAYPFGIATPGIGSASVSPRSLRPFGFAGGIGSPIVQRNPAPAGFSTMALGTPAIEYRTKYLAPYGFAYTEEGYPRVFDPTRKLFPPSVAQAGIFGDTAIANRSLVIRTAGGDFLEMAGWATVESNRRAITAPGMLATAFGTLLIANKSPSIAPPGINSLAGPAGVGIGYSVRYITPGGNNSMRIGSPTLTKTPSLAPVGFAGAAGVPTIWHRIRTVEASGSNMQRLGTASVWFRYRFIPTQGFAASVFGLQKIEHGRRTLLAVGAQHAAYGLPLVTNADRTIAPASIYENFAAGHMVGGLRFLGPVGFDAARFGSRIIPEIQQVYPLGFTGLYGLPLIFNFRKLVAPTGITTGVQPADRWGTARAWNLRQYVSMAFDPDSGLNPPAWPQWTKIENRTRTVRTAGHSSLRIGDSQIDNKARPLHPGGIPAASMPESYKAGLVAYRVRSFSMEGIEAPYMPTWANVRNAAAVLKPSGSVATLFGNSTLENTRRAIDRIGGFDSAWYGYPMVAPRVRTLEFESRYTIAPPIIRMPSVKLYTRYVEPLGYESAGIGWASLVIYRATITPRWTLQNLYGTPDVRNVTPELRTRGRASDEYGDALVRLQWRPVAPDGTLTQLFGRAIIADRDRVMTVTGFRAGVAGDKHVVIRTGAPPYSMQTINLDVELFNGAVVKAGQGIPVPLNIVGDQVARPIINQQVIYVEQIDPMTRFGSPMVKANSIRVEPGYFDLLMGEPFVSLRVRRLHVTEYPDKDVPQPERPRLSPHTIYAVMDAPQQAKQNHPQPAQPLHYVDGLGRQPGVIFGRPDVSLRHRVIYPGSQPWQWIQPGYGNATLHLMRHYVRPTGFSTYRAGWHTIPGTQTAEQFNSVLASAYGFPKIWHYVPPGPRTVRPSGVLGTQFGASRIELFHRQLWPSGHYATLMGTRNPSDSPYMWQGLRVGPLMPTIPTGTQMDKYGQAWISYRVRGVEAAGFDAFLCEYDLKAFDKRMRVTRPKPIIVPRAVAPVGILASEFSASDVRHGIHFIRPDGNSDQYRKGAF